MDFNLPTYTWRGKTYKTLNGLFKRVVADFDRASMSFDRDAMIVKYQSPTTGEQRELRFARVFRNGGSLISDDHD